MKHVVSMLCALAVGLGIVWAGAPPAQAQAPMEISLVCEYPERHPAVVNAIMPWAKSVEEKSGNKVKITYYPPNTLVPMKDGYDSVISGMIDIFAAPNLYTSEKFPEIDLLNVPFILPSAEAGSLVLFELMKKYPKIAERFNETKLLWLWSAATLQLNTTKKQVKTLEDMKGLRIIGGDFKQIEVIKALGANPIELTPPDFYLALERNTADGVILPIAPLKAMKLSDVTKYHTIVDLMVGSFFAVMNKEKFAGLPPEVRKIFEETTGAKLGQTIGKSIDQASIADAKWLKDNGHTFYVLPEAEKKRWQAAVQPLVDKFIAKAESKGVADGKAFYADAVKLGEEIGKTAGRGYQE